MRLSIDFSVFGSLLNRMGAIQSSWKLHGSALSARESRITELFQGKETSIEDVQQLGGLLHYEGEQVLLYIKDTRATRETLLKEPEKTKRFHLAECKTLTDMRSKGRFQRYHVTKRFDGKFNCTWFDQDNNASGEVEAELKVCKNCLQQVGWQDYEIKSSDQTIWKYFNIADFLRTYETVFYSKPERDEFYQVSADYVSQWPSISRKYRISKGWRCEDCNVELSDYTQLLHTHHMDGNLNNNRPDNFKALCVLCHEQQPFHQHMRGTSSRDRVIIEALRVK